MKYPVTGWAGFIESQIVDMLIHRGEAIVVRDKLSSSVVASIYGDDRQTRNFVNVQDVACVSRLADEGWREEVDLRDGLKRLFDSIYKNTWDPYDE